MTRDPRGPFRTVKSVERTPRGNLTRFEECDHVAHLNATFTAPKAGSLVRCFHCRQSHRQGAAA